MNVFKHFGDFTHSMDKSTHYFPMELVTKSFGMYFKLRMLRSIIEAFYGGVSLSVFVYDDIFSILTSIAEEDIFSLSTICQLRENVVQITSCRQFGNFKNFKEFF